MKTTEMETKNQIEAYITLAEQNPIGAWVLKFTGWKFIYAYLIMPSYFLGVYYFIRQKYLPKDVAVVESIAVMYLCLASLNFTNDAVQLAQLMFL